MKKLIAPIFVLGTALSINAQLPTAAPKSEANQFSNNQVLTEYDMVIGKSFKPLQKIPLDKDAIIIYDYDGSLKSFNLATQKINWEFKAKGEEVERGWNKFTLEDGVLYVPFLNGEMYALNHKTGEKFWELKMGLKNSEYVKSTVNQIPAIYGNNLYVVTQYENSNIYCLDKRNGELIWNYKLKYPYNHLPVLQFKDKVFAQNAPYVYNFEAVSGKALFARGFKKAMYSKPVTDGTNVIIANEANTVYALAPDNLDIKWEFNANEDYYSIDEKIFTKDSKVFFATESNTDLSSVYALDSRSGKQIWETVLPEDLEGIVEFNDKIYVYNAKGALFRLDLKTGKKELEIELTSKPISNLEIKDDHTLYYFSEAGLIN